MGTALSTDALYFVDAERELDSSIRRIALLCIIYRPDKAPVDPLPYARLAANLSPKSDICVANSSETEIPAQVKVRPQTMPTLTYVSRIEMNVKIDGVPATIVIESAEVDAKQSEKYIAQYETDERAMLEHAKTIASVFKPVAEVSAPRMSFGKGQAGQGLLEQPRTVKEFVAEIDDCFYTKSQDGKTTYIRIRPTNTRYMKYGIAVYENIDGYADLAQAIDNNDADAVSAMQLVYDDNGGKPVALRIQAK